MSLARRKFLKWSGATLLLPVAAVAGCGDSAPAPAPNSADLLAVGLYSWNEITTLSDQTEWLGLHYVRIGGVMSDAVMTFCVNNNLDVLLTVTPGTERTLFDSDGDFVAAYLAQIDAALSRYGPGGAFWKANPALPQRPITQIEVCNEPNFGYGFTGTIEAKVGLYAQVLIAAYKRIKAMWPSVKVIAFSAGGASDAAPSFVSAVLNALKGAGQIDCFDVLSIHSYSSNRPAEQTITEQWGTWRADQSMDEVIKAMVDFGISKPIWITEVGYQISPADGGKFVVVPENGVGVPEYVTPMQQAAYTIRMTMAAARRDIQRIYNMSYLDTDNFNSGWFQNDPPSRPRPVAVAMRQAIQLLSGATGLEVILDGDAAPHESPYAYRFTTPRGRVTVAWCETPGAFKLPINPGAKTVVTDMMGNMIAQVSDNYFMGKLSENPIFLY
jgi:hypothetical protein